MRTVGVIAEYNPFHRGHAYHLKEAKRRSGADCCMVVLSGNFVQRGEPAVMDKWRRTRSALCHGADLVAELPVAYATASAEGFADGAVHLFTASNQIDALCFGAETEDLALLEAGALAERHPDFTPLLQKGLKTGISYAAARGEALQTLTGADGAVYASPNNILAVEYLKALHRQNSPIRPLAVKRETGYHDPTALGPVPSATAIRKAIQEHPVPDLSQALADDELLRAMAHGEAPILPEAFGPLLHYCLRTLSPDRLREFDGVSEGLENRIQNALGTCTGFGDLCRAVQTRRYPLTRVQRVFCHILLQLPPPSGPPAYLRVLGFRRDAEKFLSALCETAALPVITNPAKQLPTLSPAVQTAFASEARATDIYMLAMPKPACRKPGQEYTRPMVIV